MAAVTQDRPTRFGLVTGLTFVGALAVALVVRGSAVVGIAALFLLFVPLEKLFALRPQKVFRRGLLTDLGVGLDTRAFRVDTPATVDWYEIDLPEVVALRRRFVPDRPHVHAVAADLTDPHWLDDMPADRPAAVVADGLLPFLTHEDFVALLRRIASVSACACSIVVPCFKRPRPRRKYGPRRVGGLRIRLTQTSVFSFGK